MGAVQGWTMAICLAALASTLLQGLAPGGSMERMIKLVVGAFVICALILPLKDLGAQIAWAFQMETQLHQEPDQLQSTVDNQMQTAAQASITNLVVAELRRLDIQSEKIVVKMDTNEDNSIGINKVEVILAEGYDADCGRAQTHLRETLGLEVEVSAHGREGQ